MAVFSLTPGSIPPGYAEALVSLADAKAHLRVDGSEDDELIGLLLAAAIDLVERYVSMPLGARGFTWQGAPGCFPADGAAVRLGLHPIVSITSITAIGADGASSVANVEDFTSGPHDRLAPKPGKSWPDATGGAVIAFQAGFASGVAASRAPGLLLAVKKMLAHFYEQREALMSEGGAGEIPPGVLFACSRYRMPVI